MSSSNVIVVKNITQQFTKGVISTLLSLSAEKHRCPKCGSDNVEVEARIGVKKVVYVLNCLDCGHTEVLREDKLEF